MSTAVARAPIGAVGHLRMWFEMTRPRVLLLVLFTGLPVLGMTEGGWPTVTEAFWVLVGTALAGAASSTFNAWLERDSDARMARTRNRPLPATVVAPGQALALGWVLTLASTVVLAWIGGWLAAAVGIATILFYVFVYTMWLKPRTPQNIVIGGAAGATAPMIAEAALTGQVTMVSLLLFLIVFLWTPPHFWAIAIFRKEEYESAGFPMMPSVVGVAATRRQSLVYTALLVACTLVPCFIGLLGPLYGVSALVSGAWFGRVVLDSIVKDDVAVDYRVFKVSISYLFIVFGMMLAECVLRALWPGNLLWEPTRPLWTGATS
jgi:protoheme IX farnesyltransferase